ncbi:hypothetical protein GA0061071_11278 [Kosakonia oryzendophytica]|uniref:Uncharacterized protein n=1 Tax=Kosakonia oryzendophytica TaxID=1005665 RepID=A0A1C4DHA3_9ENTR|nr:hypothetical protein GA0061071_11278 [Kosakonia oryzendophytica]
MQRSGLFFCDFCDADGIKKTALQCKDEKAVNEPDEMKQTALISQ